MIMKQLTLTLLIIFIILTSTAQNKMRPVNDLINVTESAWSQAEALIKTAKNKIEILPVDSFSAKKALYQTQVTTRSPMGAIIFETGGILIDDGWIRILGSGSEKLKRSLPEWNKGKSFKEFEEAPTFLLIADDVIGGFYILNGGALGEDLGKVYYFSPDNLEYEPLNITYTEFLYFCFQGDLNEYYKGQRWENWRAEVAKLSADELFSFYPYLWTMEGKDINSIVRKPVSVEEQYQFNLKMREQMATGK